MLISAKVGGTGTVTGLGMALAATRNFAGEGLAGERCSLNNTSLLALCVYFWLSACLKRVRTGDER